MADMTATSAAAPTRDGRTLHYVTEGEGRPTVVFESGMGLSRSEWGAVVPLLVDRVRCVVYDRAGLGRSPAAGVERPLAVLVDDLADLLDRLDAAPYLLVGHSWGGPIIRRLTALRPELVAGLVLVDQTDEQCELYLDPKALRQQRMAAKFLPLLARTRLLRLQVSATTKRFPPEARATALAEDTTLAAALGMQAEFAQLEADVVSLLAEPPKLGDRPATWISGTKVGRVGGKIRRALVATHQASAAAHPGGRHVEASGSGHLVPMSEPEVVAAEVLRIVDQLGSG
jgi:pimeloyl-ACP methyl ester carboxylesterase